MIKRKLIVKLITLLLMNILPGGIQAQTGTAGMPGCYLYMGVGARAIGMGKAYTALATDASAVYWNPAALARQNPYQVYFMHSTLYMDTNFDFFAASAPTVRYGSFGLGVLALSSKGFDQRSMLNEELGDFDMLNMAFLLSWTKEAYRGISIGVNYKLISQKMLEYSGIGHGFDIGLKTRLFNRLDAGLMFANLIKPKMTMANQAETLPIQVRMGLSSTFFNDKLVVSTELSKISGWDETYLNIGLEYKTIQNLALRLGLNNGRLTLGAGFHFDNRYGVDYGHSSVSQLGSSHRFSVQYAFGGFGVNAKAIPDVFSPIGENNISRIQLHAKTRTKVEKWLFKIIDKDDRVIRQFAAKGEIPEEIAWDGRDNNGSLVSDGQFRYHFDVLTKDGVNMVSEGTLVAISTQGPIGTIGSNMEKNDE